MCLSHVTHGLESREDKEVTVLNLSQFWCGTEVESVELFFRVDAVVEAGNSA